jgi:hypothetical protein
MYVISINHKQGSVDYSVYTKDEAKKEGIEYKYWKEADEGEWALSDDEWVAKVIKRKEYPGNRNFSNIYLRLPWGYTFFSDKYPTKKFKAEGRKSAHTFSGKREIEVVCNKPPMKKLAFGYAHMRDFDLAIDWAFGSVSADQRRSYKRKMRTETFKKMANKEMQELLSDHEMTQDFTMELLKNAIEFAKDKKDVTNMLKAVDNLQELHGMKDKGQVTTTNTLEASMTRKMLEDIEEEEKILKLKEVKVQDQKEG